MHTLETRDWLLMNSLIYKIYTMNNIDEMRLQFLEQLHMMISFDSADFFLPKPDDEHGLSRPVFYNIETDYSQEYEELDYSRDLMYGGRMLVYRESDIISDDARKQSDYYRQVYLPNRWNYSLQMILARKQKFVGVVTLYRVVGRKNFTYGDIFVLDQLKDHIAYRLYLEHESEASVVGKMSVTSGVKHYELTRREHTILQMIMDGNNNEKIAKDLSVSINTVKKHVLNIYRKTSVNNRVQLYS